MLRCIYIAVLGSLLFSACDKPFVASDKDNIKNGQEVTTDSNNTSRAQEDSTPVQHQHKH